MSEPMDEYDRMSEDELRDLSLKMSYFAPENPAAPWEAPYGVYPGTTPYHSGMFRPPMKDEDGAPSHDGYSIHGLQRECFRLFETNPQVYTSTMDMVGRLTGEGFGVWCDQPEVQDYITEISTDPRNRLPLMMEKYATRAKVQGELFLVLTVHDDGFVEIDFREPKTVRGVGHRDCGIVYHPRKANMPLFYQFDDGNGGKEQYPSIFIARYPELITDAKKAEKRLSDDLMDPARPARRSPRYAKIGGFQSFVVQWDMAPIKARNTPLLLSTIRWVNLYESLKMYEIDHKKASGAYLWVATFQDQRTFVDWLRLSDEDRKKTGLMARKVPGGTIFLPPGVDLQARNPQLPKISGSDTDIMQMIVSGLNTPQDMVTGDNTGTYAAVKASRGPQTDRVSNEVAKFATFLRYDLYDSIFFLGSQFGAVKYKTKVREASGFKNKKPTFRNVLRRTCELLEFTFPVSDVQDIQARTSALLGVKHGSVPATMGVPYKEVAKKLGFGNYGRLRLMAAQEEEYYPELQPDVDQSGAAQEASQETPGKAPKQAAQPGTVKRKTKPKTEGE